MADRSGYIGRAPSDSSITVARQTNQPTGVTTTFVFNSGYSVGYLDVYVNGSKLVNTLDYTANDTQNVILTTPAEGGDVVEFVAYKAFNLSKVITSSDGDFTVDGSVTATNGTFSGSISGEGSAITGIVTTLTAGDNISLSGSTGSVTITGLANTSHVVTESLVVSGLTTTTNEIEIRSSDGTPARVDYYCEVNNAHYARIQAPPHSEFSGNVTSILPTKSGDIIVGDTNGAITQHINTTGIITATTFNSTSDIKLKNNITTVDNALEVVNQLRGVRFDWKESGGGDYGVIAQELEKVLPELVSQGDPKTVNYNGIIGVLIESIKELSDKVKSLEDK